MTINITINGESVLLLDSVEFNYQLNRPSSISFTVDEYNYGNVFDLVEVYENNKLIFRGKVTKIDPDVYSQKTKLQAIENGALQLMGKQINETYPKEVEEQQHEYYIQDVDGSTYNLWFRLSIPAQSVRTIYIQKIHGYIPSQLDISGYNYTDIIETELINDNTLKVDVYNNTDDDIIDYLIDINITDFTNDVNESLFIGDYITDNYKFTDIIIDVCNKCNVFYEIDDFIDSYSEHNINYTNAMNVIENIATLVGADFYVENNKLYFFKKGKNVSDLILKDKMDNDIFIENIQINKNNSKFSNKIIVVGDSDDNDISLMAEASNYESIDKYGLFEVVINDTNLKSKEAVILKAVRELKNLCEIRTTGNISLTNDCKFKLGDVVLVDSYNAKMNQYYRIISINKKMIKSDIVTDYKIGIDSQITDVPYVIKDLNDRLKILENKDVDNKVNKFDTKKILIDMDITQTISDRDNLVYLFDEDVFDFSLFS